MVLHLQDFEINKRTLPFSRIQKLSIATVSSNGQLIYKLRVGIGSDEDIVMSHSLKQEAEFKIIDVFLHLVRIRIELISIKWL